MSKGMKAGLVILAIIAIIGMSLAGSYNSLMDLDETVNSRWGQVENQLKRRADLIPNLLETVKGYAAHEKEVIDGIAKSRESYGAAKTPGEYAEAEKEFNQSIKNLNIMVENYPDLKANENFRDLQTELAGTENRIATERMYYNESVEAYNKKVRRFPTSILAGMFGFEQKEYFQVSEADKEVPKVQF